ncbi:MAG: methylmalonyl Co-A mutase-associated GTPase MeaB [Dehalococcoidia bacterium]|nr:methylmalonyl Co-A mutase-associated GTPase MeaB [Dehalococcoidia bacterium]
MASTVTALVEKMLAGDRRALSRLLTSLEREPSAIASIMASVHAKTGQAYVVGVTGPPGAGKSTVVDSLATALRAIDQTVGVVAVDPTSTFTGGAVLGDRIRMAEHHADRGVFVRSLSTRGAHGGLSRVARASVRLLDAFGLGYVFLESVGVGQTELDVVKASDSVLVVLVPEAGDSVQVMKAGLMEIGDIYVINKADREGAHRLAAAVKSEVRAKARKGTWTPPVLMTEARSAEGIPDLVAAIERHKAYLLKSKELAERRSTCRRAELVDAMRGVVEAAMADLDLECLLGDLADRVAGGQIDPYSAAAQALSADSVSLGFSEAVRRVTAGDRGPCRDD